MNLEKTKRRLDKFVKLSISLIFIFNSHSKAEPHPDEIAELLTPPRLGETRPAWWYDVWYKNGVIIVAEEAGKKNAIISEIVTLQNNDEKLTRQVGLMAVQIKVKQLIQISPSDEGANLHGFKHGTLLNVYEINPFKNMNGIWIPTNKNDQEQTRILLLNDIGLAKPGNYYIKWSLPLEYKEVIQKIMKKRDGRFQNPIK